MIKITSKRAGFRRCGMSHPKEPVDYPDDRFSEEELDILMAESMLIVEVIEEHKEKESENLESGEPETEENELSSDVEIGESPIVLAARATIDAGKVTKDGKPLVEVMEGILGRDITAAERDEAWEKIATNLHE